MKFAYSKLSFSHRQEAKTSLPVSYHPLMVWNRKKYLINVVREEKSRDWPVLDCWSWMSDGRKSQFTANWISRELLCCHGNKRWSLQSWQLRWGQQPWQQEGLSRTMVTWGGVYSRGNRVTMETTGVVYSNCNKGFRLCSYCNIGSIYIRGNKISHQQPWQQEAGSQENLSWGPHHWQQGWSL